METFDGRYLRASDYSHSSWVLFGVPYDGTSSFKPGSRFGPQAIRQASISLEDYSPYQGKTLPTFADIGDIEMPLGTVEKALAEIEKVADGVIADGKFFIALGGEHSITIATVNSYKKKYANLQVVAFDAHCDFRDEYLKGKLSHATVLRRIAEMSKLHLFGPRSGSRNEFVDVKRLCLTFEPFGISKIGDAVSIIGNDPVYITLDLDILDPSVFPGTGNPEPGGLAFSELLDAILWLSSQLNIVGVDIVELNPMLDPSGASAVVAAKIVREILIAVG